MIDILLFPILSFVIISLMYNIKVGFALVIAIDLLFPRSISFLNIPIREILMISTLVIFFLNRKKNDDANIFSNTYFIFFITCIITILFLSTGEATLSYQIKHIIGLIYYFSYSFIAWNTYKKYEDILIFYKILYITIAIIAIYGIFCYATTSNYYLSFLETITGESLLGNMMLEERGGLVGRIQSTMIHPITWGGTCILFCFFFIQIGRTIISKWILPIILLINAFLTGSRSPLIAICIASIIYLILKKKIKLIIIFAFLLYISILSVYTIPQLKQYTGFVESTFFFWDDNISKDSKIQGSSISMRELQIIGVIDLIKDNPLFGLGHGYVDYYFTTYGGHPILKGFESIIFNKLAEGGIINLCLWISFFIFLYINIKKVTLDSKKNSASYILSIYVCYYFVFSLFTGFMQTFLYFIVLYPIMLRTVISHNTKYKLSNL